MVGVDEILCVSLSEYFNGKYFKNSIQKSLYLRAAMVKEVWL